MVEHSVVCRIESESQHDSCLQPRMNDVLSRIYLISFTSSLELWEHRAVYFELLAVCTTTAIHALKPLDMKFELFHVRYANVIYPSTRQ